MSPSRILSLALLSCAVTLGEDNVYDLEMTPCGAERTSGCTYVPWDAGAHEVCVTELPSGFSSSTGQGTWSDALTGKPWCICIWAYSNYILHSSDLPLKCEAIPSKVLESEYSLDKFKQCGTMASKRGCGDEDIRRSIQSLCLQCDRQATNESAKAALKTKCDKILAAASAAAMRPNDLSQGAESTMRSVATTRISLLGLGGLLLVGAAVGALRVWRFAGSETMQRGERLGADVE